MIELVSLSALPEVLSVSCKCRIVSATLLGRHAASPPRPATLPCSTCGSLVSINQVVPRVAIDLSTLSISHTAVGCRFYIATSTFSLGGVSCIVDVDRAFLVYSIKPRSLGTSSTKKEALKRYTGPRRRPRDDVRTRTSSAVRCLQPSHHLLDSEAAAKPCAEPHVFSDTDMPIMNVIATVRLLLYLLTVLSSLCDVDAAKSSVFSTVDAEMVKKGFLRKFGLDDVPVPHGPTISIPTHVWDIYHDEDYEADWVRHYYPKELLEVNSGLILSFNLSVAARIASEEKVVRALMKLRIDRKASKCSEKSVISVFFLDGNQRLLLGSQGVENETDWVDLDVTGAFSTSSIDTVSFAVEFSEDLSLHAAEATSISSLPFARLQSAPLIVFSESSKPSRARRKRSTNERRGRRRNRKHHRHDAESHLCRKAELYVDFDELNWQDWIMAPKGYSAGQCIGGCPHPMPAHLNASNHAIIQSLLHSLNPHDVPPPSCVPTETSPLSILYVDVDNVIVIKEYPDMRVEACGCR
ncbi:unnamed protein product [Caenorhabditis auriculariae]|uniref:TGF-beta family profile domain-containing protein n=1 Tax=Caenorhabditis auriculariae TaxID=2777116 RepID=A0A8S1HN83_9PELO|nr:unnamed protein product [Caenorhabditis auriculariae]